MSLKPSITHPDDLSKKRRVVFVLFFALLIFGNAIFQYIQSQTESSFAENSGLTKTAIDEDSSLRSAQEALGELAIRGSLTREGYSRNKFSNGWATIAGCDMRNRILQRDLDETELDEDNCTVLSGVLNEDPFTSQQIEFSRGRHSSRDIHIEHLVAVSDAWRKGAQELTDQQRRDFYNDPLNLLAVSGEANMEKGDKDASRWLPQAAYQCRYVARQIAIKLKYQLWITPSEHGAMSRVLDTCPLQVLPVEEGA